MSSIAYTQKTKNEEEQACLFAMQLGSASLLPMVLKSAIELELLEIIAKAGDRQFLSPEEISAQIPTKNPEAPMMLDRILMLLASYSVLKCEMKNIDGVAKRFYGAAPVLKYLTRNDDGVSVAPFVLLSHDKVVMKSWYYLNDAILEGGIPFNKAYGLNPFEYTGTDQRFNKIFNNAMANNSTIIMKEILKTYTGFEGLGSLVDVGGGIGVTLNMIISKNPSIKGINFDLPFVIRDAPAFPGVEHVEGDMFVSVPKGDSILLKSICHNWSDQQCFKILKNCYGALPQNGKVIIVEAIIPEYPDTSLETRNIILIDVVMMMNLNGGKERTEKEYEALAKSAGFRGFQVICSVNNTSVMEFLKNT